LRLVVEQRSQIHGRKMPEVKNFQRTPAAAPPLRRSGESRGKIPSVVGSPSGGKRDEHGAATVTQLDERPCVRHHACRCLSSPSASLKRVIHRTRSSSKTLTPNVYSQLSNFWGQCRSCFASPRSVTPVTPPQSSSNA
jgi:hypothetical protein